MNKIPLWGKIVGGCSILLVLGLFALGGCVALVALTSDPESTPTSSPETSEPVETTPAEPETESPTTEPEKDTPSEEPTTIAEDPEISNGLPVNSCVPDVDMFMAESIAAYIYSDVTIFTDQVYVVAESEDLSDFYIVAGSSAGTLLFYITDESGEPMGYAANEAAWDNSILDYPENLGAPAIDTNSETYKVAEGCVS